MDAIGNSTQPTHLVGVVHIRRGRTTERYAEPGVVFNARGIFRIVPLLGSRYLGTPTGEEQA